jgi:nickel-dependent lactate racemase
VGAMEILAQGGDIFIVSEISEGFGSPEYLEAQRRLVKLGMEGFLADIMPKQAAAIDEWQTEEQLKPMRKGTVHLFTKSLSQQERHLTAVEVIDDLAELHQAIVKSAEKTKRIAVIPEGPYILPFAR